MGRVEISDVVTRVGPSDLYLRAVSGAHVQVNIRGGGAATVYADESSGETLSNPLTTDSKGRIEGWLEEGSYDLVVTSGSETYTDRLEAFSPGATGTFAIKTRLALNVKDYGAVGDGVADDTTAIQNAINAAGTAGGGVVFIPRGTYKITAELSVPGNKNVNLVGEGMWATTLSWPTDLGSGKFALKFTAPLTLDHFIDDISFIGKTSGWSYGVAGTLMYGVQRASRTHWNRCRTTNFYAGMALAGNQYADHSYAYDCRIGGNYYGILFTGAVLSTGDVFTSGCDLSGNYFASVACSGKDIAAVWQRCHFGYGPFCFFKEAIANDNSGFMTGTFDHCSFENWRHAMFYDDNFVSQNGGTITPKNCTELTFVGTGVAGGFSGPYDVAGYAKDAAWQIGYLAGMHVVGTAPIAYGPPTSEQAALVKCEYMHDAHWGDITNHLAFNAGAASPKPLFYVKQDTIGARALNNGDRVRILKCSAATSRYDAVAADPAANIQKVKPWTSGKLLAGVSQEAGDGSSASTLVVQTEGRSQINCGASTFNAGDLVKPSTANAGQVVAAASSDVPRVGIAVYPHGSNKVPVDIEMTR